MIVHVNLARNYIIENKNVQIRSYIAHIGTYAAYSTNKNINLTILILLHDLNQK
jgi:hypothetical protein